MAALAPADAARLYAQALDLLERDTTDMTKTIGRRRVEVLLGLARARLAYSKPEGIETLHQAGALAKRTATLSWWLHAP